MPETMRLVLLRAVHLEAPCLNDVNLTISAGDYLGILGPQAGQLLRVLALLDPPTGGYLFYQGRLVEGEQVSGIAYVAPGAAAPHPLPALLLVDEPSPELLDQLERQGNLTLVIASADPEIVARAQTLSVLRDRTLISIGG